MRRPDLPRAFRSPFVPLFPILGILVCASMIFGLGIANWLRLGVWLAIGLVIYAFYGRKHSKLRAAQVTPPGPPLMKSDGDAETRTQHASRERRRDPSSREWPSRRSGLALFAPSAASVASPTEPGKPEWLQMYMTALTGSSRDPPARRELGQERREIAIELEAVDVEHGQAVRRAELHGVIEGRRLVPARRAEHDAAPDLDEAPPDRVVPQALDSIDPHVLRVARPVDEEVEHDAPRPRTPAPSRRAGSTRARRRSACSVSSTSAVSASTPISLSPTFMAGTGSVRRRRRTARRGPPAPRARIAPAPARRARTLVVGRTHPASAPAAASASAINRGIDLLRLSRIHKSGSLPSPSADPERATRTPLQ